jgi:hypothetical protein
MCIPYGGCSGKDQILVRDTQLDGEDDVINDMKKLKIKNWTSCIQERSKWKLYFEKAKTFKE